MNLDIGCGTQKRGDIGIDIKKFDGVDVVCDAHYLPFVSNSFENVFLYQVLEHCFNPVMVMQEIMRVGKIAHITVPNIQYWRKFLFDDYPTEYRVYRLRDWRKIKESTWIEHLYGFQKRHFEHLAKKLELNVEIKLYNKQQDFSKKLGFLDYFLARLLPKQFCSNIYVKLSK